VVESRQRSHVVHDHLDALGGAAVTGSPSIWNSSAAASGCHSAVVVVAVGAVQRLMLS
jgi:hypothetical protein